MATPVPKEIKSEFIRLSPETELSLWKRLALDVPWAVSGPREIREEEQSAVTARSEMRREVQNDVASGVAGV